MHVADGMHTNLEDLNSANDGASVKVSPFHVLIVFWKKIP